MFHVPIVCRLPQPPTHSSHLQLPEEVWWMIQGTFVVVKNINNKGKKHFRSMRSNQNNWAPTPAEKHFPLFFLPLRCRAHEAGLMKNRGKFPRPRTNASPATSERSILRVVGERKIVDYSREKRAKKAPEKQNSPKTFSVIILFASLRFELHFFHSEKGKSQLYKWIIERFICGINRESSCSVWNQVDFMSVAGFNYKFAVRGLAVWCRDDSVWLLFCVLELLKEKIALYGDAALGHELALNVLDDCLS